MYNSINNYDYFDNLQNFLDSNLNIMVTHPEIKEFFRQLNCYDETDICEFRDRIINIDDRLLADSHVSSNITKIINDDGYVVFSIDAFAIQQYIENLVKNNGDPTIILLNNYIKSITTNLGIPMWKKLRFLPQIERLYTRLRENYFLLYWYNKSVFDFRDRRLLKDKPSGKLHVLQIRELGLSFLIYAGGIVISSLAFLHEIFGKRYLKCLNILYQKLKRQNLFNLKRNNFFKKRRKGGNQSFHSKL